MRQQQAELKQERDAMAAELRGIREDSHRANATLMERLQHRETALAAERDARVRDAVAAKAKLVTVLEEKAVHEAEVTPGVQTDAVSPALSDGYCRDGDCYSCCLGRAGNVKARQDAMD
ncbi:hypothetical protein PI124_g3264 [Phytophthora idaei]|nr:hypothetical protein PI124_g3264 [Phytophthora idaei]